MSNIKEVLRLKYLAQLSNREIQTLGVASKSGVSNFTSAFEKSGLNIHLALHGYHLKHLTDSQLLEQVEEIGRII